MRSTRLRQWISLFVLVALLGVLVAPASASVTERTVLPNGDVLVTIYPTPGPPDSPPPVVTWTLTCGHCGHVIAKGTGIPR